jgi:diadenylate cyclase
LKALLYRLFVYNLGLKLFSIAAAFLLWALIATEPMLETTITVPIEFHNVPQDLEILWNQPPNVHLQLKGPQSRIRSLSAADAAVVLDLVSVHQPGSKTFTLDSSQIVLPRGVSLVRSMPSQIRLVFETRVTRDVRVLPRFSGTPQSGYVIDSYTVDPPALKVVGPASRMASLDFVTTDPIDLSSLIGNGSFFTNAYLDDPQLRFANLKGVRVQVSMRRPSAAVR